MTRSTDKVNRWLLDGDPAIVGHTISVNGTAADVIGILPSWFRFPADDNVIWMPLLPRGQQADRGWHAYSMVADHVGHLADLNARGRRLHVIAHVGGVLNGKGGPQTSKRSPAWWA